MRRKMLSMSQTKLADALGLTFQQVQKYEKGTNRIGASRLQQISHILKVPISFFFEDPLEPTEKKQRAARALAGLCRRLPRHDRRSGPDQGFRAHQRYQAPSKHRQARQGDRRREGLSAPPSSKSPR
jgi:transcriptional regulator with XRE-family HTH domain